MKRQLDEQQDIGIKGAVKLAGSQQALAERLGVKQQAVSKWLAQGWVPTGRAQEIETEFGIPRSTLVNPKLLDAVTAPSL